MTITGKHTSIENRPPPTVTRWLGSAAGRALDQLLSTIYEPTTREWLSKHLKPVSGGRGLHVGCGSGGHTFLMAALLGENFPLTGMDFDPVLIERALLEKERRGLGHVKFHQSSFSDWALGQTYDVMLCRTWPLCRLNQAGAWAQMARHLKAGGLLFAQVMDLSSLHAFPYNHAFARSVELINELTNGQAQPCPAKGHATEHLQRAGFELVGMTYSPPAFVPHGCNRITSLFLEWGREDILLGGHTSREELNSLLLELKQYETQEDTLVSRPGLYHIQAKKPNE